MIQRGVRSCPLYSTCFTANFAARASLKCGNSFCFGLRAMKFQKRITPSGALTAIGMVAQTISAKPSTVSQERFQVASGVSPTHELFRPCIDKKKISDELPLEVAS